MAETASGPLYVPGALPDEIVDAERDGERGRLLAIARPSRLRVEPFCPYFGRCGGCVAQHAAPGLYADWKRDKVVAALARAGVEAEVVPLLDAHGAGRRRVTLHARDADGAMRVGFMEARSHRLVAIDRCPIAVPGLARAPEVAARLAGAIGRIGKPLDVLVTATAAGLDVELRGSGPLPERRRQVLIGLAASLDLARLALHGEVLIARRPPGIRVGPALVVPPPGAFLQATQAGEAILAGLVLDAVGARAKRAVDLFAGSGPFTLALARSCEVLAVDGDEAALQALERAARGASGLRRVECERRDLFRRPLLVPELDRFDAIVFDPPRAGAQAQVAWIAQSKVPLVIGVACDAGTFARDAAMLVAAGYRLERVIPVDQFKYSAHVELVGVFRRTVEARRRTGRAAGRRT